GRSYLPTYHPRRAGVIFLRVPPARRGVRTMISATSNSLIAYEEEENLSLAEPGGPERLAGVFNRIARQLREARELRRECDELREENADLREALSGCVEACDRFLAPTLEPGDNAEDDDRARARLALEAGKLALARRRLSSRAG